MNHPIRLFHRTVLTAALFLSATGCNAMRVSDALATSESHVQHQATILSDAAEHLRILRAKAIASPDAQAASADVDAAAGLNQTIAHDVDTLGQTAEKLQAQIDAHKNDWLGPRARRVRNWIILIIILLVIGAVLLNVAPLLGGPLGGAALLAGHLLTVFVVPLMHAAGKLLRLAWTGTVTLWQKILGLLQKVGDSASTSGGTTPPAPSTLGGSSHATTGSQ